LALLFQGRCLFKDIACADDDSAATLQHTNAPRDGWFVSAGILAKKKHPAI
jgi:hypothetical protein